MRTHRTGDSCCMPWSRLWFKSKPICSSAKIDSFERCDAIFVLLQEIALLFINRSIDLVVWLCLPIASACSFDCFSQCRQQIVYIARSVRKSELSATQSAKRIRYDLWKACDLIWCFNPSFFRDWRTAASTDGRQSGERNEQMFACSANMEMTALSSCRRVQ